MYLWGLCTSKRSDPNDILIGDLQQAGNVKKDKEKEQSTIDTIHMQQHSLEGKNKIICT